MIRIGGGMAYRLDPAAYGNSWKRLPRVAAAVVFDMDGLLFDTETLHREAIVLAAAEGGHEIAAEVFNRMIGLPWA